MGKEQGGGEAEGGREGGRGPRLFQLRTVLSRASLMDLQAAPRQSSVAASCLGIRSEKKFYMLTLFVYLNKRCLFSHS